MQLGYTVWPLDPELARVSGWEPDRVSPEGFAVVSSGQSRARRGGELTAGLELWDEVPSGLEYRLIVGRSGATVCYSHLTWIALTKAACLPISYGMERDSLWLMV